MPLARVMPNQATADLVAGTGQDNAVDFGFPATRLRVQNERAVPAYLNFQSTTPSTGGMRTCSGDDFVISGIPISCVAVASTTTTTGTVVRVSALGA